MALAGSVSRSRPGSWSTQLASYLAFRRAPSQIAELDGLRGLAIILVLLRHAYRPFEGSLEITVPILNWDFSVFMANGWVGVDLFFVLSGFLITHHIIAMKERQAGLWRWRPYLTKRILRIVPSYYAVLALVVLGTFPYYDFPDENLSLRVAYHILFLQDYLPANLVVAFWSLGVEEKFYLLAPPIIIALMRKRSSTERLRTLAAFLALAVVLRVVTALTTPNIDSYEAFFQVMRSPFHMTLDPLLIGVALAIMYRERNALPRLTSVKAARIAFYSGLILFLSLTATHEMMATISLWDKTLQPLAIAAAFGAIMFGLLFGGGPRHLFRGLTLFLFARLSYCLYLVHIPLIPLSLKLASQHAIADNEFAAFFTIFITLSILASLLLHYGVEKPFLILKSRAGSTVPARPETVRP